LWTALPASREKGLKLNWLQVSNSHPSRELISSGKL
jgi:hypothetical protein